MYNKAVALAQDLLPEFYTVPKVLDFGNPNQDKENGLTFENKRNLRTEIMKTLGILDNDGGRNSILVQNAIAKAATNLFLAQYY